MSARCPKCHVEVAPGAAACPACGLAAAHFDAYQADPIDAPAEVEAAWQATAAAWDDDSAHERFRAAAAQAGAFAFAAGAYRQAARERAGDARAADGLARVQRMAEAALLTRPLGAELARDQGGPGPGAGRGPYRGAAMLLVALLLLAAVGIIAVFMIRAMRDESPERPASGASRGS